MSKEKTMYRAVHQAVARAAAVLKENDHQDESFLLDLGTDGTLNRDNSYQRQLSFDSELFPTFSEGVTI